MYYSFSLASEYVTPTLPCWKKCTSGYNLTGTESGGWGTWTQWGGGRGGKDFLSISKTTGKLHIFVLTILCATSIYFCPYTFCPFFLTTYAYCTLSKGRSYLTVLSELAANHKTNYFISASNNQGFQGWERGIIWHQPPLPRLLAQGGGGERDWLGPPLSSILANSQAGAGDKGQSLQTTNLHISYVLSSMFPGHCIPNLFSPNLPGASYLPFPATLGPVSTSKFLHTQKSLAPFRLSRASFSYNHSPL